MPCENQIDPVTWWRSTKFRQKSFISLSLATKREIKKSETMAWKTILMRSFWYQKFEDPTIHVTVATCAKFWGLKFQNGFTHAKLRGRDPIFRYCPIIRTCSFTWASQNKFSTTLQISGFISTESHYEIFILNKKRTRYRPLVSLTFYYNPPSIEKGPPRSKNQVGEFWILRASKCLQP